MNDIDINYLKPLLEETLYTEDIKHRNRVFNPLGRHSYSGHGLTLLGIITSIKAKRVLELGVAQGGTTLSLLLGSYINNGHLTCVDKGVFPIDLNWVKNLNLSNLQNHIKLIKDDSINFLENDNEKYDFIFIDDWHNGEHVYNELELIKDKISETGVIALHDTMYGNNQPYYIVSNTSTDMGAEFGNKGPYGGVQKFLENNEGWELSSIPADHGLTILRKVLIK
jgi:predicted O-methyltransferase YrrM